MPLVTQMCVTAHTPGNLLDERTTDECDLHTKQNFASPEQDPGLCIP